MSITKFPAAFAAAFFGGPCALAQTETRFPEVDVSAARAKRVAAGLRDLLRVQSAPARHVPVTSPARRAFCQFLME